MSRRQMGEPLAPGDATRWRDGLLAALAMLALPILLDVITHWPRWAAALKSWRTS